MKRWALVVFGLSACGGLGWLGVTWSQHRSAAQETSLPDLTKTPVNADAASWASGDGRGATGDQRYSSSQGEAASSGRGDDGAPRRAASTVVGATSGDRPPADPFQGITQTAGTLSTPTISGGTEGANSGSAASRPNPRDRYGDARYMGSEPQQLNADPARNRLRRNRPFQIETIPPTIAPRRQTTEPIRRILRPLRQSRILPTSARGKLPALPSRQAESNLQAKPICRWTTD